MESLFEDEIYELTCKFTQENYSEVVDWVIRNKKIDPNIVYSYADNLINLNETALSSKLGEYNTLYSIALSYLNTYIKPKVSFQYYDTLYKMVGRAQSNDIQKVFTEMKEKMDHYQVLENLKREYLLNTEMLINDLLEIIKKEFNMRMDSTRNAIREYVVPHRKALKELNSKINECKNALQNLENDNCLTNSDKKVFIDSITLKLDELANLKKQEVIRMKNVKIMTEEIRKAKETFEVIITYLESKKESNNKRKEYLALISSLQVEVPKLESIFSELAKVFIDKIDTIKNSAFLISLSINKKLIDSIENQEVINSILNEEEYENYDIRNIDNEEIDVV